MKLPKGWKWQSSPPFAGMGDSDKYKFLVHIECDRIIIPVAHEGKRLLTILELIQRHEEREHGGSKTVDALPTRLELTR